MPISAGPDFKLQHNVLGRRLNWRPLCDRWHCDLLRRLLHRLFRTALPAGSNETVRFAFFSCADYTHGWYNAYEHMAGEELDFVVCLGDYIYDETYHTKAGGTGVRPDARLAGGASISCSCAPAMFRLPHALEASQTRPPGGAGSSR